jgi:hypothetical protein
MTQEGGETDMSTANISSQEDVDNYKAGKQTREQIDATPSHEIAPGSEDISRGWEAAVEAAKESAQQLKKGSRRVLAGLTDELRAHGRELVDEEKGRIATRLRAYADAVQKSSDALAEKGERAAAQMPADLSKRITALSRYLDETDPRGLLKDLEQAGRKHAALALSSLFCAGVLIGEFARASQHTGDEVIDVRDDIEENDAGNNETQRQ